MIELSHVSAGYLPGKPVLEDVSFHLPRGSFHFLSGASGAGKTTLLGIMALAMRPQKGTLRMFGQEAADLPREALPALRRKIGVVSQDYRLLSHLTVEANVALPLKIAREKPSTIRTRTEEMLEWVGLKDQRGEYPETLSGGQKQRVAIARAVVTHPEILLCDEPSGNLDIQLSLKFMYLFEALHKMGTTVFFATHDDYLIEKYNYPVLRMVNGRVVET